MQGGSLPLGSKAEAWHLCIVIGSLHGSERQSFILVSDFSANTKQDKSGPDMINAEDEVHFDLRMSCSCYEAVIRIMDSSRQADLDPDDPFIPLAQVVASNGSLENFFYELRETAREDLLSSVEAGIETSVFLDKEYAVNRIDTLFEDFKSFLTDINNELALGKGSALRIDDSVRERSGVPYIYLSSLSRWTQTRYGIPIMGWDYVAPPSNDSPTQQDSIGAKTFPKQRTRMLDQGEAILAAIVALGFNPLSMPKIVPGKCGLRSKVEQAVASSALFSARKSFGNAWGDLLKYGETAYEK